MNKKWLGIVAVLPVALLVGCGDEKSEPIQPDKEPVEIAKERTEDVEEAKKLNVVDVANFFTDERFLKDYQEELKKHGYEKPVKEILLAEGAVKKMGLLYQVEDGLAVLEYDADTKMVLAVTSFENLEQAELQEKKTKLYALENEMNATTDETKKKQLQAEVEKGWQEIAEIEQGQY